MHHGARPRPATPTTRSLATAATAPRRALPAMRRAAAWATGRERARNAACAAVDGRSPEPRQESRGGDPHCRGDPEGQADPAGREAVVRERERDEQPRDAVDDAEERAHERRTGDGAVGAEEP